jgi:hypothetical protein
MLIVTVVLAAKVFARNKTDEVPPIKSKSVITNQKQQTPITIKNKVNKQG